MRRVNLLSVNTTSLIANEPQGMLQRVRDELCVVCAWSECVEEEEEIFCFESSD